LLRRGRAGKGHPEIKAGPSECFTIYGGLSPDFSPVTHPGNEVTNPLLTRLSGNKTKNQNHEKDWKQWLKQKK
jgi:hypothetical protein